MAAAALVLAAGSLLVSVLLYRDSRDLVADIRREAAQRRDQSCKIDERRQKADVDELRDRYDYLRQLPPSELAEAKAGRGELLNRAVVANLGRIEADAREDDAAPFCDDPGVGLPEPDPVVPKRPAALR